MSLHERLDRIWYGEDGTSAPAALLAAASLPYGLAVGLRNLLYTSGLRKETALPVPCVAVGNIVAGGTGKTPAVSWIVDFLAGRGRQPAIISRGYGGSERGPARVPSSGGITEARRFGDEPAMLAARHRDVPVVVGRDRRAAGGEAVKAHGADVLVADDAFQHRPLARDLDVVLIDAGRWFGNGRLLPGGPLRERTSAIGRADVVIINRISAAIHRLGERREELRALAPEADLVEADLVPDGWRLLSAKEDGGGLPRGSLFAFCGLASPGAFHRTLESMDLQVAGRRTFPDHHPYSARDLEELAGDASSCGAAAAVTTEKDAVRIGRWPGDVPLWALSVRLEVIAGRERLESRLAALPGRGAP